LRRYRKASKNGAIEALMRDFRDGEISMIARIFPRRTNATPTDAYAFVGEPNLYPNLPDDITEVHVSVTFTWDLPKAERLAELWNCIAPARIGGPATGMRGEAFTPGRYLQPGYVVTSRRCPNRCWFCSVPARAMFSMTCTPERELWADAGINISSRCNEKQRD
jgi:radical SAM superfamily enzyme YgiQ (UPF0313 family)